MKKRGWISAILAGLLLSTIAAPATLAVGESFLLRCHPSSAEIALGEKLEIVVTLERTDAQESYLRYAMQDEIEYDTALLEYLPEESEIADTFQSGERSADSRGYARVLVNYVDMSGTGVETTSALQTAKLVFRAKSVGSASLRHTDALITDKAASRLPLALVDCAVTIKAKQNQTGAGSSYQSPEKKDEGDQTDPDTLQPPVETPENGYIDVAADAWYANAVKEMTAKGYMTGTGTRLFSPDENMTRGMLVTVLHRMSGSPAAGTGAERFPDVAAGAWYAEAVAWASEIGVAQGTGAGFEPDEFITREQLCTMFTRYAQKNNIILKPIVDKIVFADHNEISAWARSAVETAQQAGLVNGRSEHRFAPQATATRAEVATLLSRFIKLAA